MTDKLRELVVGPLFDKWFSDYAPTVPEYLDDCAAAAWQAALVAEEAIEYQIGAHVEVILPSGLTKVEWRPGVIVGSAMIFDVLRYEIHGKEKGREFVTMATWRVMRPNAKLNGRPEPGWRLAQ